MFAIEPKTFHDAINPLLYFNCFVGLGAFRLSNQSDTTYFLMKLHTVIITLIHWATIYVTLSSLGQILDFENTSPMALMMYKIIFCTNSCIVVMAPLLVWFRKKELRDCLRRMAILDDTFKTVLGARNEYRRYYIRMIYQIIAILLVMFVVGICDTAANLTTVLQMNLRSILTFCCVIQSLHDPILVMLVLDISFCTFVGYLGKKFRDINDCLLGLIEKPSTLSSGERLFKISRNIRQVTPENEVKSSEAESLMNDKHHSLREIRKAHVELCKLSQKINHAFGIQILISMAISFVMITGLLYTIYSAFSWNNITRTDVSAVMPSATWAAIYAIKIWMVNHSCWSVSNEAERTGELIYELLNSRVHEKLEREVQEFGLQMLQNSIRFNACGFFTLDYTFVQGVIGSITTYLIILIQMSHISESPAANTTVTVNSTSI